MTHTHELIQEIDGVIHWRSEVLERYPEDFRNRLAMHQLQNLKQQLETIEDPELEQVLESFDDRTVQEPVIPELLKQIGFSWKPQIREFVEHLKSELVRAGNA